MRPAVRMRRRRASLCGIVLAMGLVVASVAGAAGATEAPRKDSLRSVLFVGNNWDGTADIIDPQRFTRLRRINVVPDKEERLAEIRSSPDKLGYYLAIQQFIGEGHDQYVDDMFTSHDGREVYVSRPSFADVVGIDLATEKILWRVPMDGYRSDHMAISPDGTRLLVSDSTARKVHVIDPRKGKKVGEFESGDSPHENNYSKDGSRIFHASIGTVYTPADRPILDSTKGDRWFQVVDAKTNEVLERLDIGQIMEDHGYEDFSSAVRPMAIAPDEKTFYLQLSFLHGFVVFDLESQKPLRVVNLPVEGEGEGPRETYLLDSAHHGLAINDEGTKLCAAGTMSDYVAIVSTKDYSFKQFRDIDKPYWSTNSGDGRYCFVSASGGDEVVVLDYAKEREVARFAVGDHPQRMRMGVIRTAFLDDEGGGEQGGGGDGGQGVGAGGAGREAGGGGPGLPATGYGLTFVAAMLLAAGTILTGRLR